MKQLFIIANWKSHNIDPLKWLEEISNTQISGHDNLEIIICPSFTLLEKSAWFINNKSLPIKVGSQDISKFDEGAYTGEINGSMLQNIARYVIIGHSERREKLGETDQDIEEKVQMAKKYNLTPIVCVQSSDTRIPDGIEIVAYEPTFAIGTGIPDTPENASEVIQDIKEKHNVKYVLYGGSVSPENVYSFTSIDSISGVLVGTKSLEPIAFSEIIKNA